MSEVKKELDLVLHSKKEMASMNVASIAIELVQGVLSIVLFFFYESVLGLSSLLTATAIAIYAVYDAFNDPLVGWFTDRPFKWTQKWGRRFPFIFIFFIPMLIFFVLIFSPPALILGSQLSLFLWLVIMTCLFDTFESFFTINFWALGPDKFRAQGERRTIALFEVFLGFIGVLAAFILPGLIYDPDIVSSFSVMAWVCVAISLVCWVFMIPGIRDDQKNVDEFLNKYDKDKREGFIESFKKILSQKSYLAFLGIYILYQAMIQIMQASIPYHVDFTLNTDPDVVTLLLLMFFIGGLISTPIWVKITSKTEDNGKTWLISATLMAIFSIPLTFVSNLVGDLIVLFLYGLGFGGFWVMITPVYSDVIDESVVKFGKRMEASYGGLRQFFLNLARVIQAFTLGIVHTLTGFVPGSDTQTPTAIFGIQLHLGLIPAIYVLIGVLIFWKFYDITPEKVKEHKKKIAEMDL
ncbi:MAG: putative Na+/melibiose symporter-like transporter [Promethearchaeota archaeon]|nr:MAG: putative Na+/melibiose symporter-like transporter [Candidatus Lokiarchaeota archaeon]